NFTETKSLLWRERGDDFFEARVASQPVPERLELEKTIAKQVGQALYLGDLVDGRVLVSYPGVDLGPVHEKRDTVKTIFAYSKKLTSPPTFAYRLLASAETCINDSQKT